MDCCPAPALMKDPPKTTADLSLVVFAACNGLRIAGYLPQMFKLARTPSVAQAFCFATWTLFAAANISTAVYAGTVLGDAVIGGVQALGALCCTALIGLAWWRCRHPVSESRVSAPAGQLPVQQEEHEHDANRSRTGRRVRMRMRAARRAGWRPA